MSKKIISRVIDDWSPIDNNDFFFHGLDESNEKNFGIHYYNGNLYSSGNVGVGRLYDSYGHTLKTQGKEHIVIIHSSYHMDPWIMLEKVMTDSEYDSYLAELEKDNKFLYKIFYDQPIIKLNQDTDWDGQILYALSFINQCYLLCRKGIKKQLIPREENLTAKIKGRIDIKNNIRKNTCSGRNDRFYCKYIDFPTDTLENRILKATLIKCKTIIDSRFTLENEIVGRLHFCMNSFRGVRTVPIKSKDFNNISTTGLYIYYNPLIKQAKCILGIREFQSYAAEDGAALNKSVYTIPYMVNMETVFEFYVRTVFRDYLNNELYRIETYSKKLFYEKGVEDISMALSGIHLSPYCIPDLIIYDKRTNKPLVVMDAKYKKDNKPVRADSHQLLSYVSLTGVNKCGFIMPGEETKLKIMRDKNYLSLNSPLFRELKYYELILGNKIDESELLKLIEN